MANFTRNDIQVCMIAGQLAAALKDAFVGIVTAEVQNRSLQIWLSHMGFWISVHEGYGETFLIQIDNGYGELVTSMERPLYREDSVFKTETWARPEIERMVKEFNRLHACGELLS